VVQTVGFGSERRWVGAEMMRRAFTKRLALDWLEVDGERESL